MEQERHIELFNELTVEGMSVLKELFDEEVRPLIQYRAGLEKKIADKAIKDLYALEQEV